MGDIKANHSQSELYKANKVFATYNWSKLDLYYHGIDLQNTCMGGWVGLNGKKANLSPAKLKLC